MKMRVRKTSSAFITSNDCSYGEINLFLAYFRLLKKNIYVKKTIVENRQDNNKRKQSMFRLSQLLKLPFEMVANFYDVLLKNGAV
jgi:hypothetical protein